MHAHCMHARAYNMHARALDKKNSRHPNSPVSIDLYHFFFNGVTNAMAVSSSSAPWTNVEGKGSSPQHPIYSKLSMLNREMSSLTLEEVKIRLEQFGLTKM